MRYLMSLARRCGAQLLLCGAAVMAMAGAAQAQVVINEVMADNRSAVENNGGYLDYVELHNPSGQAVTLTGMSLTDDPAVPRKFVFPAGASIPAGGYILVWCDTNLAGPGLRSGFGLGAKSDQVRLYAADGATLLNEVAFGLQLPNLSIGRIPNATGAFTLNSPTALGANAAQTLGTAGGLRINEWMARPATGEDWLELYNTANLPAPAGGLVLTDKASGTPDNRPIPALSFIAARGFQQIFASDLAQPDADHLDFKLGADGETLTLYGTDKTTIIDRVVYGAQVSNISQGRAPDGSDSIVTFQEGRHTPGAANANQVTTVVISEVLSHTDPPLEDAVELQNISSSPVDISHWWLSDAASQPRKYRIPAGTVIPAGGFVVFFQNQLESGAISFTFDAVEGDEVFLSAGDAAGNLTGEQTFARFGPSINGVSIGRYVTSVGPEFVPLRQRTFGNDNPNSLPEFRQSRGAANALPRIGPAVISEVHFQPPDANGQSDTDNEFIELHNPGTAPAPLFHPIYQTNTWRLRDGITYDFPRDVTIPAGGYLVLVSFDPALAPDKLAAFRAKYSVSANTAILGPYSGKLSDSGESVELQWPDETQGPDRPDAGFVPYELLERIQFAVNAPWPSGANGTGQSLQRKDSTAFGNEPLNWTVGAPSPGRALTVNSDSDSDGMPDSWELSYNLNPQSAADAAQDSDGDGLANLQEYRAGTSPRDAASGLKLSTTRVRNVPALSFQMAAGRAYAVSYLDALGGGAWTTLTNFNSGSATGAAQIVMPGAAAQRFFRVSADVAP